MRNPRLAVALLLGAFAVTGLASCATGGGGGTSRDRNRIVPAELAEIPNGSAFEAVQRLRPRWLQTRGVSSPRSGSPDYARVFIDNAPSGGIQALHRLAVQDVDSMVFMNAGDATTRYGTGFNGGLIKVFTRGGG